MKYLNYLKLNSFTKFCSKENIKNYSCKCFRNNKGLVLIIILSIISIILYEKSDTTQLEAISKIGPFITGIGIMIAAFQFTFQDKNDRRGQIKEIIELSDQIKTIDKSLETLSKNDGEYFEKTKEAIVLFHRVSMLLEHEMINFDDLWIMSGQSLGRNLIISIKICIEYHGTIIAEKNNLTDEFIFRYRNVLMNTYNLLSKREVAMEMFRDEVRKLARLNTRQEYLTTFVK